MPRSRRDRLLLLTFVLLWVGYGAYQWDWAPLETDPIQRARIATLRQHIRALTPLHQRKARAQAGEWLAVNKEHGQTFNEYLLSQPPVVTGTRTTLYIQPLGHFTPVQQQVIEDTRGGMEVFFNVPVITLPAVMFGEVPDSARRIHPAWGDHQLLAGFALDFLKPRLPADAVAMIAFTPVDLWPGDDWNFVFGMASLSERVGVWSLYRFGDPETDYQMVLQRTFKVATHETGHMFGIHHCIHYACGMNGSNSLEESDAQPLAFCSVDAMKICLATGADPALRFHQLAAWAEAHELATEADTWQREAAALAK